MSEKPLRYVCDFCPERYPCWLYREEMDDPTFCFYKCILATAILENFIASLSL